MRRNLGRVGVGLALAVGLAGCSSPLPFGGPTATDVPTATATATAEATPDPAAPTADGGAAPETVPDADPAPAATPDPRDQLDPSLREAFDLLDAERAAAGAPALRPAETLTAMASTQASSFAEGSAEWSGDFGEQLAGTGFASGVASVQIDSSPAEGMRAALEDAEMRPQLLDATYSGVGLALTSRPNGQSVLVVVLGYRADDGALPPQSQGAEEALVLTNAERAEYGLAPLTVSEDLNRAAQGQADHQASILEMTHDGNGGLGERLGAVGYRAGAENVAVGQQTVAQVVQGWIDSPGHHTNIVDADMTEMGFAVAFGTDGRAYFAQVFGDR